MSGYLNDPLSPWKVSLHFYRFNNGSSHSKKLLSLSWCFGRGRRAVIVFTL